MTTIYLIRHGETVWNADGRFQGQQNSPLNDLGREQARIVARAMANYPIDAIYTSDLDRAADTAEAIASYHSISPIRDRRLREASFGEWEGFTIKEITARNPEIVAAWRADSLRTRPPGGETLLQIYERVSHALLDIAAKHPDGHVAVVGHGGSLRSAVALALHADLSIFRHLRLDNCSITTLCITDSQYSLIQLNDCCHLSHAEEHHSLDESGR